MYLGRLRATDAVPALGEALTDESGKVRSAALHALGEIGADAVPALRMCLASSDKYQRRDAIRILGRVGGEDSIAALIEALGDSDPRNMSAAGRELELLHATEAVPALLDCLDEEDNRQVFSRPVSALLVLGRMGDARAIPKVAELAEKAPTLRVSALATDALAELGDPRAIPQFVSLLTETDRHFADGRWATYLPEDLPFKWWTRRPRSARYSIQRWAADRLVELKAADAAPAIDEAAKTEGSRRERRLLRKTARRLRSLPT